jgi:hypothetical protein
MCKDKCSPCPAFNQYRPCFLRLHSKQASLSPFNFMMGAFPTQRTNRSGMTQALVNVASAVRRTLRLPKEEVTRVLCGREQHPLPILPPSAFRRISAGSQQIRCKQSLPFPPAVPLVWSCYRIEKSEVKVHRGPFTTQSCNFNRT